MAGIGIRDWPLDRMDPYDLQLLLRAGPQSSILTDLCRKYNKPLGTTVDMNTGDWIPPGDFFKEIESEAQKNG